MAAIVRVAVDLPFVPTTCTARNERCGFPSRASSASMRPRPKPSAGHGLNPATQSVFASGSAVECIELPPVALELLPLGRDDVLGCVRDEPLVAELLLGAGDLLPEALPLLFHIAVRLLALGLDDRVEDPLLVALQRGQHAA